MPLLSARALTRRYGARVALDAIDLDLPAGAALAVYGANGAGKSTLLRLAAGLERPTSGVVAARGPVGYLAHATHLYDDLTVEENLRFVARLHRLDDAPGRVLRAMTEHGIEERRHDPVRGLSRGLKQRTALARALLHAPRLLLLDEPTTGLDAASIARLTGLLAGAVSRGAALVVATHDEAFGAAVCPASLRLARGRIVARP